MWKDRINNALLARQEADLMRWRRVSSGNKSVISFADNDYLDLAHHPKIIAATQKAIERYGAHSGGSQLILGYTGLHQTLEERLAEFTGFERCLLFSSGFAANYGALGALLNVGDHCFHDRENHASLLDGTKIARARAHRFKHKDYLDCRELLEKHKTPPKILITDAIFSMSGSEANLQELVTLKKQFKTAMIIDDTHGFGCLGEKGQGSHKHQSVLSGEIDLYTSSLAKGFAGTGGFVAGNKDTIEYLIQFARTLIYSAAIPASAAAAMCVNLEVLEEETWRREKLIELIEYFKTSAEQLGVTLKPSNTAIQAHPTFSNCATLTLQKYLWEHGYAVAAIRPPSVAKGEAQLRITIKASHTKNQIDALLELIHEASIL